MVTIGQEEPKITHYLNAFEAALQADPRDPTASLYLGAILLKEREVEKAASLLELALQAQPENRQATRQRCRYEPCLPP